MRLSFVAMMIAVGLAWVPLIASTPAAPWNALRVPGTTTADYSATIKKLKTLKVNVQWENEVDIVVAFKDLESKSQQADPKHKGIEFKLSLPVAPEKPDPHWPVIHRKVNILLLDNPSIFEVIEFLAMQTDLAVQVGNGVVIFLPAAEAARVHPDR